MAWNKAMRAWASEGPKKAARPENGGRRNMRICTANAEAYDLSVRITGREDQAELTERLVCLIAREIVQENRRRGHRGAAQIKFEAAGESLVP